MNIGMTGAAAERVCDGGDGAAGAAGFGAGADDADCIRTTLGAIGAERRSSASILVRNL